jgi:Mysoin-binding motif of peroxisomes
VSEPDSPQRSLLNACRSTPLPPVTRLEEGAQARRCMRLRQTASECLSSLLQRHLQAEGHLKLLADIANLARYHDIYDISSDDLHEAETVLPERGSEDRYSLRSLRTLFSRLYTTRKSILCCLLALSADGGDSDIATWGAAVEEMRDLATITGKNITRITNILGEHDRGCIYSS